MNKFEVELADTGDFQLRYKFTLRVEAGVLHIEHEGWSEDKAPVILNVHDGVLEVAYLYSNIAGHDIDFVTAEPLDEEDEDE